MNKKAFTIIEIIMVVIIIGILTAMVVPNLAGRSEQARLAAAKSDIEANLTAALDMYEMDNGTYPTTEQGLMALLVKPSSTPVPTDWNGPYLKKKKMPTDPWGNPYEFAYPGIHNTEDFDLYSLGQDGVQSEDDIVNWGDFSVK